MTQLITKNISKSFSSNEVIKDVCLSLKSGERILIYGENGIGKSTLLKILSGHLIAEHGTIEYCGQRFEDLSFFDIKRNITLISSTEDHLYPRLTGLENIEHFSKLINLNSVDLSNRIEQWSEISIFNQSLDTIYHQCSQGMKKILELFTFSLSAPKVLLLDECFKSFDLKNREIILKKIDDEFRDSIIVMTSHHVDEITKNLKVKTLKLNGELHAD